MTRTVLNSRWLEGGMVYTAALQVARLIPHVTSRCDALTSLFGDCFESWQIQSAESRTSFWERWNVKSTLNTVKLAVITQFETVNLKSCRTTTPALCAEYTVDNRWPINLKPITTTHCLYPCYWTYATQWTIDNRRVSLFAFALLTIPFLSDASLDCERPLLLFYLNSIFAIFPSHH